MNTDPFDLTQYNSSFKKLVAFGPDVFGFAQIDQVFAQVSESIYIRQLAVSKGFTVPESLFVNIRSYSVATPAAITDALETFQDALSQLVEGSLFDQYAYLPNCFDVNIGFFLDNDLRSYKNGISSLFENQSMFTAPPDISNYDSIIEFVVDAIINLNEVIEALNSLHAIHGRLVYGYPYDDACSPAGPPGPPEASAGLLYELNGNLEDFSTGIDEI